MYRDCLFVRISLKSVLQIIILVIYVISLWKCCFTYGFDILSYLLLMLYKVVVTFGLCIERNLNVFVPLKVFEQYFQVVLLVSCQLGIHFITSCSCYKLLPIQLCAYYLMIFLERLPTISFWDTRSVCTYWRPTLFIGSCSATNREPFTNGRGSSGHATMGHNVWQAGKIISISHLPLLHM